MFLLLWNPNAYIHLHKSTSLVAIEPKVIKPTIMPTFQVEFKRNTSLSEKIKLVYHTHLMNIQTASYYTRPHSYFHGRNKTPNYTKEAT